MPAQPHLNSGPQAAARLGVANSVVAFRRAPLIPAGQPDASPSPPPRAASQPAPAPIQQGPGRGRPSRSRAADAGALVIGLGLLAGDAVPEIFRPITFFRRNARTLALALVYFSVPLVSTAALYLLVPGMVSAFPINAAIGWAYLGALFLATGLCSCVLMAGLRGMGLVLSRLAVAAIRRARG